MDNPLSADLDNILAHTQDLWEELRSQCIFIAGEPDFLDAGCWRALPGQMISSI